MRTASGCTSGMKGASWPSLWLRGIQRGGTKEEEEEKKKKKKEQLWVTRKAETRRRETENHASKPLPSELPRGHSRAPSWKQGTEHPNYIYLKHQKKKVQIGSIQTQNAKRAQAHTQYFSRKPRGEPERADLPRTPDRNKREGKKTPQVTQENTHPRSTINAHLIRTKSDSHIKHLKPSESCRQYRPNDTDALSDAE